MKGLLKGLTTTLSTAMRKPVTIQYPEERHPLPVRQRSFPVLTWDFDHDEPFCTGCNVCIRNCPVDCMSATMQDNPKHPEGTSNRRKIVEKFWIDYARCMRCNICVEVCPFEAIVMDNNWSGHEHAVFDRRDLHMDIDELTRASRSGQLVNPFRPQDSIELLEKLAAGEAPPEEAFKGAKATARRAQADRVATGLGVAIQERPPEKKAVVAKAGPGAAAEGEEEVLTESKIRARRMRAERQAKEHEARGEAVPAEILADIEKYRAMKPGVAASGTAATATAAAGPAVEYGAKGEANSFEKVRARRMRAERKAKEALAAGQPIPDDVIAALVETGSEMAPAGARAAAAPAAAAVGAAPAVAYGAKGEADSFEKVRARRMRAERKAREAVAAGQPVPADVLATLKELGSDLAAELGGGA